MKIALDFFNATKELHIESPSSQWNASPQWHVNWLFVSSPSSQDGCGTYFYSSLQTKKKIVDNKWLTFNSCYYYSFEKLPVRVGVSVFLLRPWHFQMKHTWRKNDKTVKEYWKQVGKQRWRTNRWEIGLWLSKAFSGSFLNPVSPLSAQV